MPGPAVVCPRCKLRNALSQLTRDRLLAVPAAVWCVGCGHVLPLRASRSPARQTDS